jgi:hypothetical protein
MDAAHSWLVSSVEAAVRVPGLAVVASRRSLTPVSEVLTVSVTDVHPGVGLPLIPALSFQPIAATTASWPVTVAATLAAVLLAPFAVLNVSTAGEP